VGSVKGEVFFNFKDWWLVLLLSGFGFWVAADGVLGLGLLLIAA
jgi:hypothetical protein